METPVFDVQTEKYATCIEGSKRVRWDIDADVFRGRQFDFSQKFLPDSLSKVDELPFLTYEEARLLSHVQGRTYANMFGFVERFIVAKILEISEKHWLGDQVALEALIRFCDEELKHQELFRRVEVMLAHAMPEGYNFPWDPNEVAAAVLSKSTWAVMALIYEIELFTQVHYKQSISKDENLSEMFKDIFLFHWKEEAHHAYIDALEWPLHDKLLNEQQRDQAIDDMIDLVLDVDGILQKQSSSDSEYFFNQCAYRINEDQMMDVKRCLLKAYRGQYIFSGMEHPRFQKLFGQLTSENQRKRVNNALASLR